MRIGIFGGTFDPVHFGHLIAADMCCESLNLDQVRFIPARNPPHKPDVQITDGEARAEMLVLAVCECPEFLVDRRELERGGPSFTVDTLADIAIEHPDAELFVLMGADSLRDLPTWRHPERIAELATIVACNRPGMPRPVHETIVEWVGARIAARVISVEIPGTDLSATDLRRRVAEGRSLRFRTPEAVEAFIVLNRLYVAED